MCPLTGVVDEYQGIDGKKLPSERVTSLEYLLVDEFGELSNFQLQGRMRSKKNVVLLIGIETETTTEHEQVVAKLYIEDTFKTELEILTTSRENGLLVPKVIRAQYDIIILEKIQGTPLVEVINETFDTRHIDELARWYYNFHSIHNKVKGDPRLRNFIVADVGIYGLDFEEVREDDWMVDIAGISASLLDTDPIFGQKKQNLSWRLLEQYLALKGTSRTREIDERFVETVVKTLQNTAALRNDPRIKEIAHRIQESGISFN